MTARGSSERRASVAVPTHARARPVRARSPEVHDLKITEDPRLDQMLAEVWGGASAQAVAARYGVNDQALRRVVRKTVPPSARGTAGGLDDATIPELMVEVVAHLRAVDVDKLPPAARTAHVEAYRRALETLAKFKPPEPPVAKPLEELPEFQAFVATLFPTVEPFPLVRALVASAFSGEPPVPPTLHRRDLLNTLLASCAAYREHGEGDGAEAPFERLVLAAMTRLDAETTRGLAA